ncbi:hypothetical protein AD998_06725 [bacterium 336/3]|jgi:hypothetical protein|nr:hypothetical protein AD998_06725 [bacterium 336/3]
MFNKLFAFCLFIFIAFTTNAQSVFEDDFTKEYTFGINLNTNGGFPSGVSFKYGKITDNARVNTTYAIELVGIRHPQEYKFSGVTYINSQSFVRAKQNYLHSLRLQFGKDGILFRKAAQEGVQVNAVVAGGLSLGFLKPYMIRYDVSTATGVGEQIEDIPFYSYNFEDANKFQSLYGVPLSEDRIIGRGSFFGGFDGLQVVPGFNAKIGLSFEVGAFKTNLTGVEAGFTFETFAKKMPIMNVNSVPEKMKNYGTFAAMYISFFFGGRR